MAFMSALTKRGRRIEAHRPWPRVVVDVETWRQAIVGIAAGEATLSGLWSDGEAVHMALIGSRRDPRDQLGPLASGAFRPSG